MALIAKIFFVWLVIGLATAENTTNTDPDTVTPLPVPNPPKLSPAETDFNNKPVWFVKADDGKPCLAFRAQVEFKYKNWSVNVLDTAKAGGICEKDKITVVIEWGKDNVEKSKLEFVVTNSTDKDKQKLTFNSFKVNGTAVPDPKEPVSIDSFVNKTYKCDSKDTIKFSEDMELIVSNFQLEAFITRETKTPFVWAEAKTCASDAKGSNAGVILGVLFGILLLVIVIAYAWKKCNS